MPRERTDMRKIREIIRLQFDCKMSANQIAKVADTIGGHIIRRMLLSSQSGG